MLAFSPRLPQLAFVCNAWPTAQNVMSHSGLAIPNSSLRKCPTDVSIGQSGGHNSSHEILSPQVTLISVNLTRLASTLSLVTIIKLWTTHFSLFYHRVIIWQFSWHYFLRFIILLDCVGKGQMCSSYVVCVDV